MPVALLPACQAMTLALSLAWAGVAPARAQTGPAPTASASIAAPAASAPRSGFKITAADDAWRHGLPRNAQAATQAYMGRLPAEVVKKSNAYFEGGYWLQLWDFLLGLGIAALLLHGRHAARLRDWAQRVGRKPLARDALFGAGYALAAWGLSLPLTVYQGFVREHAYGMATQTLIA